MIVHLYYDRAQEAHSYWMILDVDKNRLKPKDELWLVAGTCMYL